MQSLILDQFVIWPLQQFAKDYEVIGDSIGQGQYGQVFTAKPSKTSCTVTGISRNYSTVAVKFLKCKKASEKLRIRDEIDVLKDMTHDNVVTLLGAYEAQDQFIQILEYLSGGELFQRVIDCGDGLSEWDIAHQFMEQICRGCSYLTLKQVVHLDIKPENVMCSTKDSNCLVKIVDFGFARKLGSDEVKVLQGTPEFVSPEVINFEAISLRTDMWSVGVLTYVLLSGLSPFLGEHNQRYPYLVNNHKMWKFFMLLASVASIKAATEDKRDFKLTVIMLTMDRHNSLARVLKSIAETDFESDEDYFDIEIHVDKSVGLHYDECIKQANNFTMPNGRGGKVIPRIFEKNHGLRAAWFESWYPKPDDEYCIIIEDDLEMSPFWFTWLKKAWLKYGDREDMAGISLQRQFLMFKKPERSDMEIINNHEPFLYKLVGTWAFSPHPKNWRLFLDWFNSIDSNTFDPYVRGLITSDWLHMHNSMGKRHMTWEQWHVYYSEHHHLYTMYVNLPNSYVLASNWREAGVHNRQSFNRKDYPTLDYCAIQLQEFPDELRKYGWDAKEERIEGDDMAVDSDYYKGFL